MRFIDPKVSRRHQLPLIFSATATPNIGNANHCRVHPVQDDKKNDDAIDSSASDAGNSNSNSNSNNDRDEPVDSKVLRTLMGHRKGSSSHEEGFVYEADGCSSDDDDGDGNCDCDGGSTRSSHVGGVSRISPRAPCLPQHREHDDDDESCEDDDDDDDDLQGQCPSRYSRHRDGTEKYEDAGTVPTAATSFYSTDSGRSHTSGGTSGSSGSNGSGSAMTPPSLGEDATNSTLYGYENKMEGRLVGVSREISGIMSHLNSMTVSVGAGVGAGGSVAPCEDEHSCAPVDDGSDAGCSNNSKKSKGSVSRGNSGGSERTDHTFQSERTEQTDQSGDSRGFGSHTTQSSITLFSNYTQEGNNNNNNNINGNGFGNGFSGTGNTRHGGGGYGANAANVISSYGCYNPGNGNGERRSSISSVTLELSGTGWLNPPKNAHDSSLNKSMSISHLEGQGGYDDDDDDDVDDSEDNEVDASEQHRRHQDPHLQQQPYQQDPRRRRSSASVASNEEEQDMVGTLLPVNGGHSHHWIKSQSFHAMSSCGASSQASTVSSTITGTSSAFGSASGSGSNNGSGSGSGSSSVSSASPSGASSPKRSGFRRHTHNGPGGIPPRDNVMITKAKQQRQQQMQQQLLQQKQKKQQHPYHGYTTGTLNNNSSLPSVASVSTCSSFSSSIMTDGNGSSYYYNDNSNILINNHNIDNDNNHNSNNSNSYASSSFVSAACLPPPPPHPSLSYGNSSAAAANDNNNNNNHNNKSGFTTSTNSSFFSSKTQSSFFSSGTTSTSTSTERSEEEQGGGGGSSSFLSTAPSNGSATTTSSTSTKVTRGRRLSAVKHSIPSAHRHNRSSEQQQPQQRRNRSTSRHSTTRGVSASSRTSYRRRRSSTTERDTTYNSCNSSLYYSTYSTKDSAGSAFSAAASDASDDNCEAVSAVGMKSSNGQRRHRSRSSHRRGAKSRSTSRGSRVRGDSVSSHHKSGVSSSTTAAMTPTTPVKRSIFSTVKDTIVKSKSFHVVYPPEGHRYHKNIDGDDNDDDCSSDYHTHSAPASTAELLLSLQETNHLNESTIETLQQKLQDMTNERDAFRSNGEKVMDVLSKQKSQLEIRLEHERREMAAMHEKERREWEERALKWKEQVRVLEEQAKRREGSLTVLEERLKKEEGMRGERIKALEGQVERLVEMQMKKVAAAAASAEAAAPATDSPTTSKDGKSCDVAKAVAVLAKEVKQNSNSSVPPPPPPPQRRPRRRASSPPESPSSSLKMTPEESRRLRRYMQVEHVEEVPPQSKTTVYAPAVGLDMAASTTPQGEWDIDETSMQISAIEAKYKVQLQQRESDIGLLKSEVYSWKEKYDSLETKYHLLEKEHREQKETKSMMESELSRCKKTIADQLREIEEREEEEDMKEQDWEDRLARVLNEKDRLARENEHMKNLAAPFLHSSFNCSVSTGISTINDEIAQQIVELAEENSKLVDKCRDLEEELKEFKSSEAKAKSRNHDLKSEWENYKNQSVGSSGNSSLKENHSDLSYRVSELETNKASLEKSIMTLTRDLESAKKDTAEATNLIESLRSENESLRTNQGDKKVKIRHLVQHLRASFVTEGSEDNTTSHNSFSTHSAMTDKEQTEALAMIEEIQLENEELRASMEEAMGLAGRMNDKMISFVSSHEATVQEYESKLKALTDDLRQERLSREAWENEKEELLSSMEELKHEVEEAHSLVETCESLTGQLNVENTNMKKDLERVSAERAEAYETLRILQAEIDSLRKSVNEAKERAEGLTMNNNNNELPKETRDKMRALIIGNSKLSKDLAKEKCILECLQASFDKLQAENQTIKEMVVALRQENGRLRDGEKDVPPTPPLPRTIKPPHAKSMLQSSSDIEARLKKIEKENKGLRDANELLSTKLFDEMEKTDSLRAANEGLAARICKLVSFIQQNSGTLPPPPPPQKKMES